VNLFDINGWEFIVILVVALLVIGPERLPEYSAKLTKMVRQVRGLADAAKVQLREQMGSEFDDVDWKQYDPRQYDPRRIVREALMDDAPDHGQPGEVKGQSAATQREPNRATPYDEDST
jgi:sec-independent protein translocase protein TatB